MTVSRSVTEDVAKTMWCPFARLVCGDGSGTLLGQNQDPPAGFNRPASGNAVGLTNSLCIASACMAWRWSPAEDSLGHCGNAGTP